MLGGLYLGRCLLTLHVHSFTKQTKGGPTIREEEGTFNPRPQPYHFLTVCSKANHTNSFSIISKVDVPVPQSPWTLVRDMSEKSFAT